MGFALTPGEAPLHFSRSKNVMHVAPMIWTVMVSTMVCVDWEYPVGEGFGSDSGAFRFTPAIPARTGRPC